jgi:hypothetical protein
MYYAGQAGRRLPVPIFQAMEDFAIFGILLLVERWLRVGAPPPPTAPGATAQPDTPGAPSLPPAGIVLGVGMILWGIERFLDEHLWLGEDGHLGSLLVQIAGVALAVAGIVLLATRITPWRRWRQDGGAGPYGGGLDGAGGGLDGADGDQQPSTEPVDIPSAAIGSGISGPE